MYRSGTKYIITALLISVLTALSGCQDPLLYNPEDEEVGEGMAEVRLSATFSPVQVSDLAGSRSADNLMDGISDLSVLIYDLSGSLIPGGYHYLVSGTDFSTGGAAALNGEPTLRATITTPLHIPFGKYRIYAIANAGDLQTKHPYDIMQESTMRTIKVPWKADDMAANCQMSGWFHVENGDDGKHANTDPGYPSSGSNQVANVNSVTINGNKTLHAWLRRASAKVTVAYDASALGDNVWIYLRSVRLRNIAGDCQIIANNSIEPGTKDKTRPELDAHDPESTINEGEIYFYQPEEAAVYASTPDDYSNYAKWPCLAKGNPRFGAHQPVTLTADDKFDPFTALYAYENLQGVGKDKKQVLLDEQDINKLDYTWRDDVPSGTFVEVDGYYISNQEGNEGSGPIRYRFMLGKDVATNYDFERNHHYKLTLMFHGQANNVDWHIDYREEEKPGIYAPDPYYVSYAYNSEMEYPIRIEGEIVSEYIDVTIERNDWRPWDEDTNDFPPSQVGDWRWIGKDYVAHGEDTSVPDFQGTAVWNGFLSLYDTRYRTEVFKNGDAYASTNKRDWYRIPNEVYPSYEGTPYDVESYPDRKFDVEWDFCSVPKDQVFVQHTEHDVTKDEGYRRYKVPTADGTYVYNTADGNLDTSKGFGTYRVVKEGNVTTFYVPLYTRALFITTGTSYTGNNPFYSYMRKARLNIHAKIKTLEGDIEDFDHRKTVLQVRRQINPKIVMRRHDNTNCFTVQLMHREGEQRDHHFVPFRSRGPWSASIVAGSGWEIVGHSSGRTESHISFTVRPTGTIKPHETRCALVEVWYHNRACRHTILLRQGYAPIYMEADRPAHDDVTALQDNVLWHSFNLWWNDEDGPRETDCPLDAGSFFRKSNNYTDAIDALNNNYHPDPTISDVFQGGPYNSSGSRRQHPSTGYFWLSPIKNGVRKTWDNIECIDIDAPTYPTVVSKFNELTMYGATVRPPRGDDWQCFVNNPNIELTYGIAYGDGAWGVQTDPDNAFRHSYLPKMPDDATTTKYRLGDFNLIGQDPKGTFGTRVCCIFNRNSPRCPILMIPIGQTGYGRRTMYRKFSGKAAKGELRYANRFEPMSLTIATDPKLPFQPLLYTIYSNYGAIYWNDETDNARAAWDINYSTFDFNFFDCAVRDACFVRFVQPRTGTGSVTPTEANPCWDYDQSIKTSRPGY